MEYVMRVVCQSAAPTDFTMCDYQMQKMSVHNDLKHPNPKKHANPTKTEATKERSQTPPKLCPLILKITVEKARMSFPPILGFFHTQLLPSLRKPCKIWLNQIDPLPGTPTRKTSEGFTNGACCWACSFNPVLWWGTEKEFKGLDLSIRHHHILYHTSCRNIQDVLLFRGMGTINLVALIPGIARN